MPMSADCQEDACNSKKRKHLLMRFGACVSPSVYAGIETLSEVVMLCNVEPCCFFSDEVFGGGRRSLTCGLMNNVRRANDVQKLRCHLPNFIFEKIHIFR